MPRDGAGRKSMSLPFTISDLRQRPEFFDTVAMRIWQAWWEADGTPLDHISGRMRQNMNARPFRSRWSPMTATRFSARPR